MGRPATEGQHPEKGVNIGVNIGVCVIVVDSGKGWRAEKAGVAISPLAGQTTAPCFHVPNGGRAEFRRRSGYFPKGPPGPRGHQGGAKPAATPSKCVDWRRSHRRRGCVASSPETGDVDAEKGEERKEGGEEREKGCEERREEKGGEQEGEMNIPFPRMSY